MQMGILWDSEGEKMAFSWLQLSSFLFFLFKRFVVIVNQKRRIDVGSQSLHNLHLLIQNKNR
jgi:hypothetical protein